jgi:lysine 2,3-aminomutase
MLDLYSSSAGVDELFQLKLIKEEILAQNTWLQYLLSESENPQQFVVLMRNKFLVDLSLNQKLEAFFYDLPQSFQLEQFSSREIAIIRFLDYAENNYLELIDLNNKEQKIISKPLVELFQYLKNSQTVSLDFAIDFFYLFKQLQNQSKLIRPTSEHVKIWMDNHYSGLDESIIEQRKNNKSRIIGILINKIDEGIFLHTKYRFPTNASLDVKRELMENWWNEKTFHLQFAVRNPELLNELLANSIDSETMANLRKAAEKGIPFFVNPYYLSLLDTKINGWDATLRQYVIYSKELVNEFGQIKAWEKEDIVEQGKPNAAGWLLPSHDSVHRRYPEVAILIPATMGRACAGLCASCQRMYDFQRGHLNFNLDKLSPDDTWPKRLRRYLDYFENDSQLRDILITGGDAFMSSDSSLSYILDEVYNMAKRKKIANKTRLDGEKYAEMQRVRLGTRIFAYLPQRITPALIKILKDFKTKATKIGIKQFVVQAHFESALEITPETANAISGIISSGWMVTNQLVLTSAASRRGHMAKLRKVLNDVGVVPYYSFMVKGFSENKASFAPSARAVQELFEEKYQGIPALGTEPKLDILHEESENIVEKLKQIRVEMKSAFVATDKTVLNLPGVGKSLRYRVVGLTSDGRRILRFDHDYTRNHSPIIIKMKKVDIIESKSVFEYLKQIKNLGEDLLEYQSIWNYSISFTEKRASVFEYPAYDYQLTQNATNLLIE